MVQELDAPAPTEDLAQSGAAHIPLVEIAVATQCGSGIGREKILHLANERLHLGGGIDGVKFTL